MSTKQKPRWFVRRYRDGAMLGENGRWYRQFAGVENIKFYTSAARAQKYGLERLPQSFAVETTADGSLTSLGECIAVYPGDTIDICGRISRA